MKKLITLLIVLLLGTVLSAQSVSVDTYGVSPRDAAKDTTDIFDKAYNSLVTVGVQTQMYLTGTVNDSVLVTPTWSIIKAPDGSAAAFGTTQNLTTAMQAVGFAPDVVGEYQLQFSDVGQTATITINAGLYLGNVATPKCGTCHQANGTDYMTTNHSIATKKQFDVMEGASDHFAEYCLACHATGYDKSAANNGFDDFDFVYPDSVYPGKYDELVAAYPDAMARADVQCEACHGTGSNHGGATGAAQISQTLNSKDCAYCHDSGTHHFQPLQWDNSGHANPTTYPAGGRTTCRGCHNGAQFIQYVEGEEITVQPYVAITCATCHDPHNKNNDHQIRTVSVVLSNGETPTMGGNGKLCMNCHQSRREANSYTEQPASHFGPHYVPQADMILGTNAVTFGYDLPSSAHAAGIANTCVDCHMAEAHIVDGEYPTAGGHSFAVKDTAGVDNVAICQGCHGDVGTSFDDKKYYKNGMADHDGDGVEEGLTAEVTGMMETLAKLLPAAEGHDMYDPHDDVDDTWSKTELKAAYNYEMVYYDHSHGIHNPAFTVDLLKVSIEALKYGGITSGAVQSVMDIPMDQGFQVRLAWTAFGSDDGVAMDKVSSYTVLRQATAPSKAANIESYASFKDIPTDVEPGVMFRLDGHLWDVVAEVAAIQYAEYSAVVPTLYNTVEGDTAWASFKVLGKTANGMVAETEAMKGYSTDDLAPKPPMNLAAAINANGLAELTWDMNMENDLNHYKVYRDGKVIGSAIEGLFIDESVEEGKEYKYFVTAEDHHLNESDQSNEVQLIVTDVVMEDGIPTEFALHNNYPNPFNPTTNIKFALPQNSKVKLTIFDSMGKQVTVLVDRQMSAGNYEYSWNATNIATGVYFFRIQADSFVDTKKMLLIK